ncbi:hypothetical protein FQA39_LY17111 [Lamprigera yunnana]|nr:hypothetical protein FQA39_LY17111 [Lamprigera yunnana]
MDQPIDAPRTPEDMFSPEQTSFLQKLFRDILTTMREKEAYYKQLLDSHVALQQEFAELKSAVSADEEREVTALSIPLKPQKAPSERKTSKVKAPSEQKSQQKPPRAVLKIVEPSPKPQVEAMEIKISDYYRLYFKIAIMENPAQTTAIAKNINTTNVKTIRALYKLIFDFEGVKIYHHFEKKIAYIKSEFSRKELIDCCYVLNIEFDDVNPEALAVLICSSLTNLNTLLDDHNVDDEEDAISVRNEENKDCIMSRSGRYTCVSAVAL